MQSKSKRVGEQGSGEGEGPGQGPGGVNGKNKLLVGGRQLSAEQATCVFTRRFLRSSVFCLVIK
jgi:hypothetical protein